MKNLISVSMVLISVCAASPASAAIALINESCSAIHAIGNGALLVGAPQLSLSCEGRSAISGEGTSCQLTSKSQSPSETLQSIALSRTFENDTLADFQGDGVVVILDKQNLSARILLGADDESDCDYVAEIRD